MIGIACLALAFIILAAVLLWDLLEVKNIYHKILYILIPCILWYGAVLYSVPRSLMGYPLATMPPDNSIIVSFHVIEPSSTTAGGIYLWVLAGKQEDENLSLHPKKIIKYRERAPRSYVLPYQKELHKQLLKAREQAKKGGLLTFRKSKKGKKGKDGEEFLDESPFKILNPYELLPKEEETK